MKLNFPVIRRYWDDVRNDEPVYPVPCIVWWYDKDKGGYRGEYLTELFPNGEVVACACTTLDELIDTLIKREANIRGDNLDYL